MIPEELGSIIPIYLNQPGFFAQYELQVISPGFFLFIQDMFQGVFILSQTVSSQSWGPAIYHKQKTVEVKPRFIITFPTPRKNEQLLGGSSQGLVLSG